MKFEYHSSKEFEALETAKRGVTPTQFVTGLKKIDNPDKLLPWLRDANTVKVDTVDARLLVFSKDAAVAASNPTNTVDATAKLAYELGLIQNSPAYSKGQLNTSLESALTSAVPDAKAAVLLIEEDFVDPKKNAQLADILTNPKQNLYLFNHENHVGVISTDLPEKEFYASVKKFSRGLPKGPDVPAL